MTPTPTLELWNDILDACARRLHIGFGLLDQFLSGPDLDARLALVADEAPKNRWLQLELRDTLALNQESDWTPPQRAAVERAAGL